MSIELSTPALLFPAISLLFLSYTNRFLALSALIRKLHSEWTGNDELQSRKITAQIENLRFRLLLIRRMQVSGAMSLVCCVLSMGSMLADIETFGVVFFVTALLLMGGSLIALVLEAWNSGGALNILLDEAEDSAGGGKS